MVHSASAIATDSAGDCYATGYFTRTANFEGTNLISRGDRDIFVAKYSSSGSLLWLKQAGGVSEDAGGAAAVIASGELLIAGSFNSMATFDSTSVSGPSNEVFIARIAGDAPSITVQPQNQTVIAGTTVTLGVTASGTAPLHYQWRFNGTNIANATDPQLVIANVQPPHSGAYSVVITNAFGAITSAVVTITVKFHLDVDVSGSGSVSRNPPGFQFNPGTVVILSAAPASGHAFIGWSGDANGTNNPLIITMTTNVDLTAHFAPIDFGPATLAINIEGQGNVDKVPNRPSYNLGEQVTLTATAGRWFQFQQWADGSIANPRSITIVTNNIYTAIFWPTTAVETLNYTVGTRTAPVGMPVIFVNGRFFTDPTNSPFRELGQADVYVSTTFPNGTIFYTTDGSQPSFTSTLYTDYFVLRRSALLRVVAYDETFTKFWEDDPLQIDIEPLYTVTAEPWGGPGGVVSVVPAKSFYRSNDAVSVTATAFNGWEFVQWLGDVTGNDPQASIQVSRNICIRAVFATTLGTASAVGGSVLIAPSAPLYPHGTTVRLTAVPAAGNFFGAWNAANGTNNPLYITVTEPTQRVSAVFGVLPTGQAALTVLISGHGQVTASPRANRYTMGQTVTLRATADADQIFLGWSGDASGVQTNLTVLMNQSKVIAANFTARPRLSLEPCGGGWTADGFRLTLTGDFGVRYEIQRSSNAVEWAPSPAVTNTFGVTQILDATQSTGQRFYRAVRR
jgi:uncharacterized repeat protein (TIGR02543 family)